MQGYSQQVAQLAFNSSGSSVATTLDTFCKATQFGQQVSGQCAQVVSYVPSTFRGNYGRRLGAVCSMLGMCSLADLPSSCSLTSGSLSGKVDLCTAEGVAGGATLPDVVTSSGMPAGLCTKDNDCDTATQQCDTAAKATVCRCDRGLDICRSVGRCVPLPPPPPPMAPCERCNACVGNASVVTAALAASSTSQSPADIGSSLYAWCSSRGYPLSSCRTLQNAVVNSYKGNMGLRAGAVCVRLQQCASSLVGSAECVVSTESSTGGLDLCSISGIVGGASVAGTFTGKGASVWIFFSHT
jgi:hypothetical protein